MIRHLTTLFAALAGVLFVAPLAASPLPQDFESARQAYEDALRSDSMDDKQAAVRQLAALGDPQAIPIFLGEYTRAHNEREKSEGKMRELEARLASRKKVIANLQLRSKEDEAAAKQLKVAERSLKVDEREYNVDSRSFEEETAWTAALAEGMETLLGAMPDGKRKRAEKELLKDAESSPRETLRLAAVELLGRCGGAGTGAKLVDYVVDLEAERAKLVKKLPRLEKGARELEARMQKQAAQSGGRVDPSIEKQYAEAKAEAEKARLSLAWNTRLVDASVVGATYALQREDSEELGRSISKIGRALERGTGASRQRVVEILAPVDSPASRSLLHTQLTVEKDAAIQSALILALASARDPKLERVLLAGLVDSPTWSVRAAAYRGLALLRSVDAIPALIERLDGAEGRLRGDLRRALRSLTGQDYRLNAELWRRWWKENEDGFQPPTLEAIAEAELKKEIEKVGTTFFGVPLESTRVLFVLDVSGSMNWPLEARSGTGRSGPGGGRPPRGGGMTRLEMAKAELTKVVGSLPDGAVFNIVLYASEAWTWKKTLQTVDTDVRTEALSFIASLEAVGGTNIYGSMQEAFTLAGADSSGNWSEPAVDTIFLLSDGEPTVGISTKADVILDMVAEKNKGARLQIHTIAVSSEADIYLMRSLADRNDGTYVAR